MPLRIVDALEILVVAARAGHSGGAPEVFLDSPHQRAYVAVAASLGTGRNELHKQQPYRKCNANKQRPSPGGPTNGRPMCGPSSAYRCGYSALNRSDSHVKGTPGVLIWIGS